MTTETDNTLALEALAKAIADVFERRTCSPWSISSGNQSWGKPTFVITSAYGHKVHIVRTWGNTDRAEVYGLYPSPDAKDANDKREVTSCRDYLRDTETPNVGVSLTRPADKAAEDVARRFLNAYLDVASKLKLRREQSIAYHANKNSAFDRLAEASGFKVHGDAHNKTLHHNWNDPTNGYSYLDLRVTSETSARLDATSIPIELAIKLAEVIRDYSDKNRTDKE